MTRLWQALFWLFIFGALFDLALEATAVAVALR